MIVRLDVGRAVARWSIIAVTILLLVSMGGAIVGAPALLPALWWAGRSTRRLARIAVGVLAGLVTAEVGWLVVYATMGERQPFILGVPIMCVIATVLLFALRRPRPIKPAAPAT